MSKGEGGREAREGLVDKKWMMHSAQWPTQTNNEQTIISQGKQRVGLFVRLLDWHSVHSHTKPSCYLTWREMTSIPPFPTLSLYLCHVWVFLKVNENSSVFILLPVLHDMNMILYHRVCRSGKIQNAEVASESPDNDRHVQPLRPSQTLFPKGKKNQQLKQERWTYGDKDDTTTFVHVAVNKGADLFSVLGEGFGSDMGCEVDFGRDGSWASGWCGCGCSRERGDEVLLSVESVGVDVWWEMGAIEGRWLDGCWVVELCGGHIVLLLCVLAGLLVCWLLLFLEIKSEEKKKKKKKGEEEEEWVWRWSVLCLFFDHFVRPLFHFVQDRYTASKERERVAKEKKKKMWLSIDQLTLSHYWSNGRRVMDNERPLLCVYSCSD